MTPRPGLDSASLRASAYGLQVSSILEAALQAVDPKTAVRRFVQLDRDQLTIAERVFDLSKVSRVYVVGAGKAAWAMASALQDILGDRIQAGQLVVKAGHRGPDLGRVAVHEAGHPLPDARGVAATQEIFDLLKTTTAEDLVIALISGGGSALLSHPAAPISLSDLQELTQNLLASGADIQSINTLRKHLDLAKGGGLALAASPAALATLILSDVVGDPLDMIASGPTVPDPTHFSDAIAVLEQHQLWSRTPKSIRKRLEQGLEGVLPETLKPGHPVFRRVSNHLIATNRDAAEAAQRQAQSRGMDTRILTLTLTGEARTAGRWLVQEGRKIGPVSQPVCLIAGGETTVTLTPDAGLGGRNQELALAALLELTIEDQPMLLVTLATDGGDGPTDAAGAVVAANSRARALEFGLDAGLILENHNAYTFFDTLDDLLKPGPTRTNVNDLAFVFCFPG